MQWYKLGYPVLLAVLAGAFIPVQTGANTFLSKGLGNLTLSTWVVFVIASLATLLILLLERPSIPPRSKLKAIPWFAWLCGGVLGSGYIYLLIFTAPTLGMANVLGIVVLGKVFTALAIDHFGWLGMGLKKINWKKGLGAALMLLGIFLIKQF